jgi:hypothetical protein
VDGGGRRLGPRRAVGLAVAADGAGQPPEVGDGVAVLGRDQEADQVGAEGAAEILDVILEDGGLAAEGGDARAVAGRALDQRCLDGEQVVLGPRRLG